VDRREPIREVLGMRRLVVLIAVVVALGSVSARGVADSPFKVIVNPTVKGSQIQRATLSSIFLKQVPRWGDGSPVHPVDQSMRSPVRMSFAADVLQRPLVEVQIYWSRKMGTGVAPPPVKPTDEEVAAYVAATPGSIGYVSSALPLPDGVRPLAIID
jgi:ABC-type phosphate transport system substrate-binding protein